MDLTDVKTYRMLSRGHNVGVFQLNGGWVKGILRDLQPETFEDIVALVALIRPGSTDNGSPKEYALRKASGKTMPDIHPEVNEDFEPILRNSLGLPLYQEGALAIIKETTGWGYGQADLLFRAFGKKDLVKLAKAKPDFFAASKYSQEATQCVWDVLAPFADYGFSLAHSVAYAYLTYETAYLKANHPAEFIAALMTHEDELVKIKEYIREAQALGIQVLPPDVNESQLGFTPGKRGIRYGLGAIKDVGSNAVDAIIAQRPFSDLDDFVWRVDASVLNVKVLTALGEAGALDSLTASREGYLRKVDRISRLAQDHRRAANGGERPLFRFRIATDGAGDEPDWDARASMETNRLGVQLTFPKIVLRVPHQLSTAEASWLNGVLTSRQPVSDVILESGGFRVPLGVKSSIRGLASAVRSIQIEVTLE